MSCPWPSASADRNTAVAVDRLLLQMRNSSHQHQSVGSYLFLPQLLPVRLCSMYDYQTAAVKASPKETRQGLFQTYRATAWKPGGRRLHVEDDVMIMYVRCMYYVYMPRRLNMHGEQLCKLSRFAHDTLILCVEI